jgi:hypothetical protein
MIHAILAEQGSNVSEISYHVPWCGWDPWFADDPGDEQMRENYYGIWNIPVVYLDGQDYIYGTTEQRIRDSLAARLTVPSHVWMSLRRWVNADADTVFMEVKTVADTAIGAHHRLFMAAAQIYRYAEYYNSFHAFGAMQAMYPDGDGQPFTHSGNVTDTLSFLASFAIPDSNNMPWSLNNLRLIAWVQDSLSQEVLQSQSIELSSLYAPGPEDTLYVGIADTLSWENGAFNPGGITIELDRNYPSGTWETVFENISNDGNQVWLVTGPVTDHARLRIFSLADTTMGDTTLGDFTISNPATIEVSPNPVTFEILAGEYFNTWIYVTNTGDVPAHGTVVADSGMSWGRPWPLSHFDIAVGGFDSVHVRFSATDIEADTVLTGMWNFSGNVIPFQVPVVLTVIGTAAQEASIPLTYNLSEAYPNPFNPTARITLNLDRAMPVKMLVYSLMGQEVATLYEGMLEAGVHEQTIDGRTWASGTYLLRVHAGEHQETRRLMLLK